MQSPFTAQSQTLTVTIEIKTGPLLLCTSSWKLIHTFFTLIYCFVFVCQVNFLQNIYSISGSKFSLVFFKEGWVIDLAGMWPWNKICFTTNGFTFRNHWGVCDCSMTELSTLLTLLCPHNPLLDRWIRQRSACAFMERSVKSVNTDWKRNYFACWDTEVSKDNILYYIYYY